MSGSQRRREKCVTFYHESNFCFFFRQHVNDRPAAEVSVAMARGERRLELWNRRNQRICHITGAMLKRSHIAIPGNEMMTVDGDRPAMDCSGCGLVAFVMMVFIMNHEYDKEMTES